jgi:hypothetical protein
MEKSSVPLDVYQSGLTGSDLHFMLRDGRVLVLDYPVRPRVRNFGATRGGARLHRILAGGTLRYREYLRSWQSLTPFFVSHEGRDWPELVALIDATPLRAMPPWGGCFWAIKG